MIPALFICHGSPMVAIQESEYTQFLSDLGNRYNPKAIVVFSAHWEERVTTISFAEGPLKTIYDFAGFPDELYQIIYPATGSSELAKLLEEMFHQQGIKTERDLNRGLDHGAWVILRHMYPKANIPIVSISVNPFLTNREQLRIGEALKGLGEEDILVIGSGATVHNFSEMNFRQNTPEPWAVEFDDWLAERILKRDTESLLNYEHNAPHAKRAVPRAEHFIPLLLAWGSSTGKTEPKVLFRGYEFGTLSYSSFEF